MKRILSLVLVLMLCLSLCACDSSSTKNSQKDGEEAKAAYNSAIEVYQAVYNGKFDKIENLLPEKVWTYIAEQDGLTKEEYIDKKVTMNESGFEDQIAYWEEMVGSDPKVIIKVVDAEKVDADVVNGVAAALKQEYGINKSDVKEIYDLILKFTLKGEADSVTKPFMNSVVKIDSGWYLISYQKYDNDHSATGASGISGYQVNFIAPL